MVSRRPKKWHTEELSTNMTAMTTSTSMNTKQLHKIFTREIDFSKMHHIWWRSYGHNLSISSPPPPVKSGGRLIISSIISSMEFSHADETTRANSYEDKMGL